jgi:DNA-binding PadR family transcriptional regulator
MHTSLLGYAILSLLARAPLSGYDLAREMKRPHAFFYGPAQISQIYPELARLREAGLVTATDVEQRGRPDKRVYTLAPAGLQHLQRWLVERTPIVEVRSELLIKAHSLWLADPEAALVGFREHERYHAAQLTAYEASLADLERHGGAQLALTNGPQFGDYLTLARGVSYEREYVGGRRGVIAVLVARGGAAGRGPTT